MMHRAMTTAHLQTIGGGNGGADIGFAVAHGVGQGIALSKMRGNGGRKGAAGAVGVFAGMTRFSEPEMVLRVYI